MATNNGPSYQLLDVQKNSEVISFDWTTGAVVQTASISPEQLSTMQSVNKEVQNYKAQASYGEDSALQTQAIANANSSLNALEIG